MTLTQINKAGLDELALDHVFTIGASGTDHYTFQGEGLNGTVNAPTLYLTRGKTYRFENGTGAHPIRIQSTSGASGTAYNTGVTNNAGSGTVIVEVQHDAPDVLYYQCTSHANMNGILYITGALADGGVTTAKIADDAVTADKIANSVNSAIAANTAKTTNATHTGEVTGGTALTIADNVVDEANLKVSNSPSNGYFLSAQSGNTGGLTWAQVTTDLVGDTSPQLGGDLDTNSFEISLDDDHAIKFGNDNDLTIKYDLNSNQNRLTTSGGAGIELGAPVLGFRNQAHDEWIVKGTQNGAVELYYDNVKKLETTTSGVDIEGTSDGVVNINTTDSRGSFIRFKQGGNSKVFVGCAEGLGAGDERDLGLRAERHIYFMSGGSQKWSINTNGTIYPAANNTYDIGDSSTRVRNIYTNDLHLSNEGSSNDIDSTWGDWTIQEGESDLFLKNNRSGKKYKFNLTEVS